MDISNMTLNDTFEPDDTYSLEAQPLEILNTITSLASVLANALIIFVISRYSTLRTRPNLYLLNWCICNFIVMLLVPASLNLFGLADAVSYELMCVWEETLYGMLFGNLLFVITLLLDWYVATYTQDSCATRCKRIHLFVIALMWIVIVSISTASVSFCMLNWSYPLTLVCFIIGYLLVFIVILVVYILRCVKVKICKQPAEKSKLELIVVTSYFLCWLPNWISMYGQLFLGFSFSYSFEHFTYFIGYSHAWVMLILLYFCDKSFKMYIRKTFGVRDDNYRTEEALANNKDQNTILL